MYAGPNITNSACAAVGCVGPGSVVIPRPDGKWLLVPGVANTSSCATLQTGTFLFDPYTMTFSANTNVTMPTGTGTGAFAFQRSDGQWVIVQGGATAAAGCTATALTTIYNPYANKLVTGPTIVGTAANLAQTGAHAIPRPDGTWLLVQGNASTNTSIYLEKCGAFSSDTAGQIGCWVAGPALTAAAGSGASSFQRQDGKFLTILGNSSATLNQYDGGWISTGIYKSEQVNIPSLSSSSTLVWRSNSNTQSISAEVKTATSQAGLQLATSREIGTSGGLINPGASDTWLQVNFNFKRTFPSYSGILTDVWNNAGGYMSLPQRPVAIPTLSEFKVTNDSDLLNLKSDGLSVFRVSTSGDIFTANGGSVNTGGADLAERYSSTDNLQPGEVVSIDPSNDHDVKRTQYAYQPDALGIVSTAPGFVAGSYTSDSYPIALVGRVPLLVSTENGPIHIGDRLTASSLPGYAMKATYAGRVLGTALSDLDTNNLVDCPDTGYGGPARKCGTIMIFVNLSDYQGESVRSAMDDYTARGGITPDSTDRAWLSQINFPGTTQDIDTPSTQADDSSQAVLAFLKKLSQQGTGSNGSEIFANRVSAVNQVISPEVVTDTLIAKNIKAGSIEGLEVITNSLSSLSNRVNSLSASSDNVSQAISGSLTIDSASIQRNLVVMGTLNTQGAVYFDGPAEFKGTSLFDKLASFFGDVFFNGNVTFNKPPTFSNDTAGFAIIKKGTDRIQVKFSSPYSDPPIVNASFALTQTQPPDNATPAQLAQLEEAEVARQTQLLSQGYALVIYGPSKNGFTIILNKQAQDDLLFSWSALSVKSPQVTTSQPPASSSSN
jgi:hypothetical protein